jgi:hypothetical protein
MHYEEVYTRVFSNLVEWKPVGGLGNIAAAVPDYGRQPQAPLFLASLLFQFAPERAKIRLPQ